METTLKGRLRIIHKLGTLILRIRKNTIHSLSIGCGKTRLAELNLDINPEFTPDVVGDALKLPFRSESFDVVYFTDVIEHLPKGKEIVALYEISRVLKDGGVLIFSTPNKVMLFTLLDPAFWVINHRHYSANTIRAFLKKLSFKEIKAFACGGVWTAISILWYSFVVYPLKRIFRANSISASLSITMREDIEYNKCFENGRFGYTLFILAIKSRKES